MTTDRRLYDMGLGRRDHTRWLGSNRYAGGAPLTRPTANLLAAYNAVSFVSVDGGVTASQLNDLSGGGKPATQAAAGSRATISNTGGRPSLLFDGGDFYTIATLAAPAGHKSVYVVQNQTGFGGYKAMFDTSAGRMLVGNVASSRYGLFDSTDRDSGITATTGLSRITFTCGGGASRVWQGETAGTATAWGADVGVSGTSNIGSGSGGPSFLFIGHMLDISIYTATRDVAVGAFLLQEYGV